MVPGEYILDGPDLELNAGRPVVTHHCHQHWRPAGSDRCSLPFLRDNKALVFDRVKAYGMRLDLPSGTSVRFEPGDTKEVKLVAYGGRRVVYGFNALVGGRLDDPYTREQSIKRMIEQGYGHKPSDEKKK